MKNYGFQYQGSKSKIAESIIEFLPSGNRFVDLFGGGAAMSHCALLSGKYKQVYYNELNPLCCKLLQDAIDGKYNPGTFKPKWISREDFYRMKNYDGYVKYIWSFGNRGKNYLFGKTHDGVAELAKKQGHNYVIFGEKIPGVELDFFLDTPKERRIALNRYAKAEVARMKSENPQIVKDFKTYQAINSSKSLPKDLKLKFTAWLRSIGITRKEIDDLTDSCMSSHYLTLANQPEIPTLDVWEKLKSGQTLSKVEIPDEIEKLINPDHLKRLQRLEQLQQLERLERLERLQQLQQLERLQQLEQLQQLERLQQLEQLEQLEINCCSYLDYEYKRGDVVYCDPPYKGCADYGEYFDFSGFLDWIDEQEYPIFFSSYDDINDDRFKIVWQKEKRVLMSAQNKRLVKTECIYVNKEGLKYAKE